LKITLATLFSSIAEHINEN